MIRRCFENDLMPLLSLERVCFADPWGEQALRETLENQHAVLLAEEDGGQISGYLGLYLLPDGAEIVRVAVKPESRKQGIASRLLQEAFLIAEQYGAESVWLEVRSSNFPACALYVKNGFLQEGRRKDYYRHPTEDAILMTRFLQNTSGPTA